MSDSRPRQWLSTLGAARAILDDIRCDMADMGDQGLKSNLLEAARCSANVTLKYVEMLEAELGEDEAS